MPDLPRPRTPGTRGDRWADGKPRAAAGLDLDDTLHDLAELASQTFPGNDGVGATLVDGGTNVFRSSNAYALAVDRMQYGLGEGPCINAVDEGTTIVSGSIGAGEQRWPEFCREGLALKVRSVLSLPLVVADDNVIGSINVYSARPDAFGGEEMALGEAFARPAASSLSSAHVLIETLDVAAFAGYGLRDRAMIETAVGLLAAQHQVPMPAARRRLAEIATRSGRSPHVAAASLISALRQPSEAP